MSRAEEGGRGIYYTCMTHLLAPSQCQGRQLEDERWLGGKEEGDERRKKGADTDGDEAIRFSMTANED